MLNPNFDLFGEDQIQNHPSRAPKRKIQYSGGFRQLQPNVETLIADNYLQQKKIKGNSESDSQILAYVQQLGIENLSTLYKQSLPNNTHLLLEKQKQQQEQSTVRLFRNLYPSKKKTETDQNQEKEEDKQNKKYAEDIWDLDLKYQKQPPEFIVKKQIEKLDKKYRAQLTGLLKKRKIESQIPFEDILAYFLLQENLKILELTKKRLNNVELEIFFLWKGFLCTVNFKTAHKKYQKVKISEESLENLRESSKYLFLLVRPQKRQTKSNQSSFLSFLDLRNRINHSIKFEATELKDTFEIKKQYTNPFNILSLTHQSSNSKRQNKVQAVPEPDEAEQNFVFKAAPVPKTTYKDPKEKIKPQPKTTVQRPFKLTEKGQITTPQQYYHFQKMRQFKAQPVPDSTYKPYKPELLSEEQKKARAVLLLQQSKYPKTMQNLEQYSEHQKQKVEELAQRHAKVRIPEKRSQIPNFQRLHAQQMVLFETIRQSNKKEIKVQPFHLSANRKKTPISDNVQRGHPEIHPYSPSKPSRPSRSTKKFEAYVNFRSEYDQKKVKKLQQEQHQKEKLNMKKEPYRQILRKRMTQQLEGHPQKKNTYDASLPMKVRVDKQKIYKEEPLLMTSSLPKEEYYHGWETIL